MVAVAAMLPPTAMDALTPSKNQSEHEDLYRFICALNDACEADCNVLRDVKLVDSLEDHAKQIMRARKQRNKLNTSSSSTVSCSRSISSPMYTAKNNGPLKVSKRRKLASAEKAASPDRYAMPRFFTVADSKDRSSSDEDDEEFELQKAQRKTSLSDSCGPAKPSNTKSIKRNVFLKHQNPELSLSTKIVYPHNSPSRSRSSSRYEEYSRAEPTEVADLTASIASTVSSSSNAHFSDVEEISMSPITARYRLNESDDSMMKVDELSELSPRGGRKYSTYSEMSEDAASVMGVTPDFVASAPMTPMTKKMAMGLDALSLLEKEPRDETEFLQELQSQVDELIMENGKILAENARLNELHQMTSCDAEALAAQKRHVAELLEQHNLRVQEFERKLEESEKRAETQESCRRAAEVAFQAELDAKSTVLENLQKVVVAKDEEIAQLTRRVEDITALFAAKIGCPSSRPSSRHSSPKKVVPGESAALVCMDDVPPLEPVNEDVDIFMNIRESSDLKDLELKKMRETILEKDREICHLYMHLSTKKKLIEEITRKFVQYMEEASAANMSQPSGETEAMGLPVPVGGVRFDLDMFLFKNVVEKQRRMEELSAALGVVDREVEKLESRIAMKERENNQLKENHESLSRSLQTVNAQVCRIQTENARLEESVREKQARIKSLVTSLEEKERQILHLDEQVEQRQTQLEVLLSERTTVSRTSRIPGKTLQSKSTPIKGRPSTASSARSSVISFSTDYEGDEMRRSFIGSAYCKTSFMNAGAGIDEEVESQPRTSVGWGVDSQSRGSSLWDSHVKDMRVSTVSEGESGFMRESSVVGNRGRLFSGETFDDDDQSNRASYSSSVMTEGEEILRQLEMIKQSA
ncbi:hypothetical protein Poli38472_009681 [Pythium oligandrum]|uniref:Uncharacterized protein n=1 Tax=Pythium oligandrum TaxID=41045 RepID=A0A8K1FKZ3_PYTOL|nr:hypothetical protein Poli38472_009681 [Pythium oligandrum]|eukprot:TMW62188.1 hypothetical protein Poli38472_009681 [Pythium oligandrum]